jgi:hypothetical protein
MIWTHVRPSRPGWYWWRVGRDNRARICEVYYFQNILIVSGISAYPKCVATTIGEWSSEPIPEPKEPA